MLNENNGMVRLYQEGIYRRYLLKRVGLQKKPNYFFFVTYHRYGIE